jgi:hypothetical protein
MKDEGLVEATFVLLLLLLLFSLTKILKLENEESILKVRSHSVSISRMR